MLERLPHFVVQESELLRRRSLEQGVLGCSHSQQRIIVKKCVWHQ